MEEVHVKASPKLSGTVFALGTTTGCRIIVGNVPDKPKERKKFKAAQSLKRY